MIDLAQMTSPDIGVAIKKGYDTVVFAVGSNEQHGPCLPVSTDTVLGDALADAVAKKLGKALKAPTVNVGCSEHHMAFPGTITLRKETLQNVIRDYVNSLAQHGFKRIVALPSHGGNFGPLGEIAAELRAGHPGVKVIVYHDLQAFVATLMKTSSRLGVSPEAAGAHAGESEVSMMMHVEGGLVKKSMVPESRGYMGKFDEEVTRRIFEQGIGALSPIGVLGDARGASADHGKRYVEDLAAAIVDYIKSS
ncbi:MAG TPA: creatininase family protein [Candidatus Desulfaltia sp.]|nr:creatininase family protein [Candidatus Desulfaltia sp.]